MASWSSPPRRQPGSQVAAAGQRGGRAPRIAGTCLGTQPLRPTPQAGPSGGCWGSVFTLRDPMRWVTSPQCPTQHLLPEGPAGTL